MSCKACFLGLGILSGLMGSALIGQTPAAPQAQQTVRPTPPTRNPHAPGYVQAKELPDGTVPSPDQDGNFIIGPTHPPAPQETAVASAVATSQTVTAPLDEGLTHGKVIEFTMSSADSKYYPGIAREKGTFGTADPNDPAKLVVTTSHPAPYTR
ncbi:MAG: hypothetical protein WA510_30175, partial [Acidobacteriaceae bacterium]